MSRTYEVETLVIGAGVSGLLTGFVQKENYLILEAQNEINFRTAAPFYLHAPIDWLPTKWVRIDIHANVFDGQWYARTPNIKHMNDYSRKTTGMIHDTALKFMDGSVKTGFLPASGEPGQVLEDLWQQTKQNIQTNKRVQEILPEQKKVVTLDGDVYCYKNLVSTMALPVLLRLLKIEFQHPFVADDIYTSSYKVPANTAVDAFQVIYITTPKFQPYRCSLMGQTLYVESMKPIDQSENLQLIHKLWSIEGCELLGDRVLRPGKFHPIEKMKRKMLLAKLTQDFSIYCIGRYSTWSYKRLEHLASDAKEIQNFIRAKELV